MMLARVCRGTLVPQTQTLFKLPLATKPQLTKLQAVRLFGNDGRSTFTRSVRNRTAVKEQFMAPAGKTAFTIGRGAVAGGAAVGLGALCYYGLGLSSSTGAIDHAAYWPQFVKDRIKTTYMYFGASIAASALVAAACLRSPTMIRIYLDNGWKTMLVGLGAMTISGYMALAEPYKEGFGIKQIKWLAHIGVLGAVLAPVCLMGGAIVMRAAWYTAGIVGGLSTVAICAPSEKFLNMGGPLAMGFGVVLASSIGTWFLPPTTAFGAGIHSMALYGGLILFSMLLMYDTQRIIRKAETQPHYNFGEVRAFDPIGSALSIYMDVLNIFVRILSIVGSGRRK